MPAKRKAKEACKTSASDTQTKSAPSSSTPNKKRKLSEDDASEFAFRNDETDRSVLGGLAGGYRITGDEPRTDPTVTVFKVPFDDKFIICEHHAQSNDSHDERSTPALIFTHGAGGGISNPATASFIEGFSRVDPVVGFQGTMNLQSRVKTFHALIEHEQWGKVLGGRSIGARAAVIIASEVSAENSVEALVLVSYPLVAAGKPKKRGKLDVRDEILKEIWKGTDVLFVVGSEDSMCDVAQLCEVRKKMAAGTWLVEVQGADHGMSMKNKKAMEALRLKTGVVTASWLKNRSQDRTYCRLYWDDDRHEAVGDQWVNENGG